MIRRAWLAPLAAASALAIAATPPTRASADTAAVDRILRADFHFNPSQIAEVHKGGVVTTSIPGSMDREIVVVGAVRIPRPAETVLALFRDIERTESGSGFLQTVRIGSPPRLSDFDSLVLPPDDLRDLRRCKPGDCKFKLSAHGFELLAGVDMAPGVAVTGLHRFARRMLYDTLVAYQSRGAAGVGAMHDEHPPREVAAEFVEMARKTPWLAAAMPGLRDYLIRYPFAPRPPGLEEFFYWSLVEFGLKKVVRLNHVVYYPLDGSLGARWAMANRQVYASHYFQNALEARLLVDAPQASGSGPGHYLLVLNVARPDGVTGLFGGIVRYKVRGGSRDGLRKTLLSTREKVGPRP